MSRKDNVLSTDRLSVADDVILSLQTKQEQRDNKVASGGGSSSPLVPKSQPPINAFSISILGHSHFNTISQYLSAITALTHSPMH